MNQVVPLDAKQKYLQQRGLQATSPTNMTTTTTFETRLHTNGTWAVRPASQTVLPGVPSFFPTHRGGPSGDLQSTSVSLSNLSLDNESRHLETLKPTRRAGLPYASSPITQVTFQWVKGELIGKGSYGHVYLALNATNGEIIAVKQVELLRSQGVHADAHQLEVIEALKFESYTLQELDHPHIVQFLGFEESLDHLSFFMEYVSGGTIGSCLKAHGRFDEEVTKSFTRQILNGLEYLHSKGIIHRDLKADNILVEVSGICKISDFGISKQAGEIDGRAFTEMKGTSFWMAPEAIDPKRTGGYDTKVDIWSIGCVILEMWTAKRPWYGEELWPVMLKVWRDKQSPPVPKNLHLNKDALDIREKCFAQDPQDRPSAAELQNHPYLVMQPGWTFDRSDIEGSSGTHEEVPIIRRVKSSISISFRRYTQKDLPPVPAIPSLPQLSIPIPAGAGGVNSPESLTGNKASANSSGPPPPIVHITPPASPFRSSPYAYPDDNSSSPSTSNSSSRWSTRRKKSFYVANPDPEEAPSGSTRAAFVYQPPPLPNTNTHILYSSRTSVHSQTPRRAPSTPTLRQSAVSTNSTQVSSTFNSDSDGETSTGLSMWQKPPSDMRSRHQRESKGSNHLSRVSNKRDSAWARPFVEDIYQHLQEFFPDHDIDEPLIKESGEGSTPPSVFTSREGRNALRGKKSIRMVAQEQVKRSLSNSSQKRKRATKLWGSRLEEVTSS